MKKIRIGICGYGNLGKGVEKMIAQSSDMELVAILSRRENIKTINNTPVVNINEAEKLQGKIDVMIMCGGSATDLPVQVPKFAKFFNTVDSFDTHAKISEYLDSVNKVAVETNHTSIISVGWDPGLFSINRLYSKAILPEGNTYTFWGKGLSQGHSDAIRRIEGVKNAVQYTIPIQEAVQMVRMGKNPTLSARQKHLRECFVVLEENADSKVVEEKIKTMPNYFADYDTIVHFIDEQEMQKNHSKMGHGGFVIHSGNSDEENNHIIEFSLKLDSNPDFTAAVLIAYARATYSLYQAKQYGAKTVLDVAPYMLTEKSRDDIIKELL